MVVVVVVGASVVVVVVVVVVVAFVVVGASVVVVVVVIGAFVVVVVGASVVVVVEVVVGFGVVVVVVVVVLSVVVVVGRGVVEVVVEGAVVSVTKRVDGLTGSLVEKTAEVEVGLNLIEDEEDAIFTAAAACVVLCGFQVDRAVVVDVVNGRVVLVVNAGSNCIGKLFFSSRF